MVTRLAMMAGLLCMSTVASANGGYGSNLPNIHWNTLETEHFYFHWPESTLPEDDPHYFTTEFSASQLATIAEDAWEPICGQFNYYPVEKTHVVVYDQGPGWEGNGFALAEYDWTGFAADWAALFRERGRAEFLSDVFVHEFAHIISLKTYMPYSEDTSGFQLGGLSEDEEWLRRWGIRPQTGPSANFDLAVDITVSAHTPFWWAEGGAEYWSHQAGTNFWGSSRDAYLRTTVLEHRLPSQSEWTTRADAEGMEGERGYNNGYAFQQWLSNERFEGEDVVTRMAHISRDHWHWSWDAVVEEATGVPMDTLHEEWKAHLDTYYGEQKARIEEERVVTGKEMFQVQPAYERNDEQWNALPWRKQKQELDRDGDAWHQMGVISPDGKTFAWFEDALYVQKLDPGEWAPINGEYQDEWEWKDSKKWNEEHPSGIAGLGWMRPDFNPDATKILGIGSEYDGIDALDSVGLGIQTQGTFWPALEICDIENEGKKGLEIECEPVPNTLRATEGAWSPDGQTIAFFRYSDGTQDLWTIKPDGTDAKRITQWNDGTQYNGVDWSADGKYIVTGMHKSFRQDLWLYELETGEWTRLTDSRGDELDPYWAPDGRIYFASDAVVSNAPRKFDVFSIEPFPKDEEGTRDVRRHTNVYGSAYMPLVSAEGHLFYTGFTGHGFRNFAVNKAERDERVVDYPGTCNVGECGDSATDELEFNPVIPDVREQSHDFKLSKGMHPMMAWPTMRVSDKNLEVGASLFTGDYLEKHMLSLDFSTGKDTYVGGTYYNDMFTAGSLGMGYGRYAFKSAYGYGDDIDGIPQTTDDLEVVDVKSEQVSDDFWLFGSRYVNDTLYMSVALDASLTSFREPGDGPEFSPYLWSSGVQVYGEWDSTGWDSDSWINPRGGRRVYVDYQHRWTHVVDPEIAGSVYDDGEAMGNYQFNRIEVNWAEHIPVFQRSTLELDFTGGYIDRNVLGWDEFNAGGRHPYDWGSGNYGNNVQFAGYEGWSLVGETMLIANASYRFPVARDLNFKLGPVYTEKVYLQFFGTGGNLWSYRVEGPSHLEGYSVVPDADGQIVREVPFADYSAKNSIAGRKNRLLYDVGAEVRVKQFIFNDWDWDSFVKVAYGPVPTAGYGDVNADNIQNGSVRDAASELSSEFEPNTVHVYVGLGTGW